jgi:hypothetical protein
MTQMRKLVLALFAGAALAGCSSGGSGSGPTINSFTATPSSLPAGGGSVTLAWNVTGATGLSIDQSVGAVTPVTSGSMSVQVTASTTFTLTAAGSSGNNTATAAVTVAAGPVTITVNGTVTDEYGAIAAGETVLITSGTSFSQSTISSATGTFSVPSVPTPYDATVLDSGGKIIVKYLGLTRPDPTLMDLVVAATPLSASIAGQLSGGTFPQTSGYSTGLFFASPQTNLGNGDISVPTSGAYSGSVAWEGPSTTTGTLYALQVHTVAGLPADYSYGTLPNVLLQNLGSLTGQNIALSPVTAGTLSGTVTVPAGFTLGSKGAYFVPGTGALLQAFSDSSATTSFSYVTPAVTNSSLTMLVEGEGGGALLLWKKSGLSPTTSGVAATLVAPPGQTLPVAAATGVTVTTPFTWTSTSGVYLFAATSSTLSYYVFTTAATATIPDLSAAGVQLPTSAAFSWLVVGIGPQTSVDAMAVPGGLIGLELTDGTFSESPERAFTSSP